MKKLLIVAIPFVVVLILIYTYLIFFNTKVSDKLFYKPGNYLFLLEASPADNEKSSYLGSFLVETDRNFNIVAKQETNYEYTGMVNSDNLIKLYSDLNKKVCVLTCREKQITIVKLPVKTCKK